MTRPIPACATAFIRGAEACRLKAYKDSTGKWTIGWGHTGDEVVEGLRWTRAQCVTALTADLAVAAVRLAKRLKPATIDGLSDHQYAALISFVFNLGANPSWKIWKVVNAGRLDLVPAQIMRFDKGKVNGVLVVIDGLINRREAEVALWKTQDVLGALAVLQEAAVAAPPSSETRAAETPPTPAAVKPLAQSKSFVGSACAAVATCVTAAAPHVDAAKGGVVTVIHTIAPFADQSAVLQNAISGLSILAAALSVAAVGFIWLKHHTAKVT